MKSAISVCLVCLALLPAAVPVPAAEDETFPPVEQLPAEVVLAPQPEVAVDADGNYLVNGRIRYLLGVQSVTGSSADDIAPTSGYDASLKWLYEEPLTYRNAQRLGFDTVAVFTATDWIRRIFPEFRDKAFSEKNKAAGKAVQTNGLPTLVDFTAFPWGHGKIAEDPAFAARLPEGAVNEYRSRANNHWVPYNPFHPEGKKLYRMIWEAGVRELQQGGNPLMLCELFNEPAYDDPSPYNRKLFAGFLEKRYGTPGAMNQVYGSSYPDFASAANFRTANENRGLFVDWSKFMESGFIELTKLGVETIRGLAPDARLCFQVMGGSYYRSLPRSNMNLFEINRQLDAISLPTGGGVSIEPAAGYDAPPEYAGSAPAVHSGVTEGILMRAFFRALADGKPMHNPEAYTGRNYRSTLNRIWLDFVRGSNATYLFEWSKRAWDWEPAGSEEGGRRIAEKFPWMILNPYAYPAADFRSIMDAKKEIFRFAEYFAPRSRNIPCETAVLLSHPTERMAGAVPIPARNEITTAAGALAFTHRPFDAVLEEQLPEGRLGRYKAVVAVGVRNTLPGTAEALRRFVEAGGILIAGREFMTEDEYGRPSDAAGLFAGLSFEKNENAGLEEISFAVPRPAALPGRLAGRNTVRMKLSGNWKVLGSCGDTPAFAVRKLGQGAVYVFTPQLQDYALGALLGTALERHGIRPALDLVRHPQGDLAVNVEAHAAKRGETTLFYLFNWDGYPKLVELALPPGSSAADLIRNRALPVRNGRALLLLEPQNRAIIGAGGKAELEAAFGPLPPLTRSELEREADALAAAVRAERAARAAAAFRYEVDPAQTAPLDLREHCNRGFADSVAGDGKGGWTDQGRDNSLGGVPWGTLEFLGVPCELIRFDQNDNRTCIMLHSKSVRSELPVSVENIPVNAKVRSLVFFHTAAWFQNGREAMRYRIRYASGRTLELPVVCGENIGDWWMGSANYAVNHLVAWKNRENRGFYGWRWVNPAPEDEIRSFDIVGNDGEIIPAVLAVSAERYDGRAAAVPVRIGQPALSGFGGIAAEQRDGLVRAVVTEKTGPWGGLMLHAKDFRPLVRRPGLLERGTLRFEVNGGCDQFGNARGGQKIQLTLLAAGRDFRQNRHGAMQNLENGLAEKAVDNDPATFQEVRIPLSRFGKLPENANGLFFQLRGDNSSGFEIRDIVIELPEEDDPPPVPVRTERLLPVNPKELYAIGQVRVQAENGGVAVQTAAESGPWSGFITHFAPLPDITPEEWKNGSLEFELDGGKTGGQQLQFTLSDRRTKQNSRQVSAGKIVPGRQTVTLPLGAFAVDGRAPEVTSLMVQFQADKSGIAPFTMGPARIVTVK